MPDLTLSADSKQYQDLALDFALNEIAPQAHAFDKNAEFPKAILKKAWEVGLINVTVPELAGGLGLGALDACVIAEEISAACPAIGAAFWANDLAVSLVRLGTQPKQQKQLLEPLTTNFELAAYCLSSPRSASAVTYKESEGGCLLDGTAIAINANCAKWLTVIALDTAANTRSVFRVDKGKVKVVEKVACLGLRCADITTVKFPSVMLQPEDVIGTIGGGDQLVDEMRAFAYPIFASAASGIISACLKHSVKYAQERKTMGVPIAKHQAVALMLSDMAKDAAAARFMIRKAAWLADNGKPDLNACLMAKGFAFQAAMKAATDAVQVFGGYGYSKEYPVEKLMRDAKSLEVIEQAPVEEAIRIATALVHAG